MNNSTFKGLSLNQNKLCDSEIVSTTIKRTTIFFHGKIKFPVSPPFKVFMVFSNDVTLQSCAGDISGNDLVVMLSSINCCVIVKS